MAKAKQPVFEEQLKRLQEITTLLEGDKISLEHSLELYKEGVKIAAECRKTLDNAKHTVQMYTDNGLTDFAESEGA
ncbi:exodeoxyribonuclease VII small subunit [Desulfovibrio sp. OttesenSCG-928-F07]|nr:exodeoxyribonuclease VII small subunit [Desulfovibrio sp. OttesenSCG-928-F07]